MDNTLHLQLSEPDTSRSWANWEEERGRRSYRYTGYSRWEYMDGMCPDCFDTGVVGSICRGVNCVRHQVEYCFLKDTGSYKRPDLPQRTQLLHCDVDDDFYFDAPN